MESGVLVMTYVMSVVGSILTNPLMLMLFIVPLTFVKKSPYMFPNTTERLVLGALMRLNPLPYSLRLSSMSSMLAISTYPPSVSGTSL